MKAKLRSTRTWLRWAVVLVAILALVGLPASAEPQTAQAAPVPAGALAVNALTTSFPGTVALPATELFQPTDGMNAARFQYTATLLNTGKVLVAGGGAVDAKGDTLFLASAELYDPATGIWTSTGSMNTARRFHTATLLSSGKVLVAGGVV